MAETIETARRDYEQFVQEQMAETVEAARRDYEQFVQEQDRNHQNMISCLRVNPEMMKQRLKGKRRELLNRCQGKLLGEDPQKQAALEGLKQELDRQKDEFLTDYEQRFQVKMAERVEAARRDYEQFVQEQDRNHQDMSSCLRVTPAEMKQRLEGKRQELLNRCRGELRGESPQKQAALEGLNQELNRQMDEFLTDYKKRFKEKKAKGLGMIIGGGGLALGGPVAGAGIGVPMGAAVAAGEGVVADLPGAGGMGLIGRAVGCKLGDWIGEKGALREKSTNPAGQEEEGESGAGCSDQEPLLPKDR